MSTTMTKAALVSAIAEKANLTKQQAVAALDALADTVSEQISAGNSITVPGIAKIALKDRPARQVRNPATGEMLHKDADRTVKAVLAKAVKDAATKAS